MEKLCCQRGCTFCLGEMMLERFLPVMCNGCCNLVTKPVLDSLRPSTQFRGSGCDYKIKQDSFGDLTHPDLPGAGFCPVMCPPVPDLPGFVRRERSRPVLNKATYGHARIG